MSDRLLQQNILDVSHPSIVVQTIQEIELNDEILSKLVTDATRAVGISASYTQKNKLAVLALCTSANVLIITFRNTVNDAVAKARQLLQDRVLCSPSRQIYAFDIGPVALSLFLDRDLRLVNGVDFQSACSAAQNRDPVKAIEFAIASTSIRLHSPDNVRSVFNDNAWIWDTSDRRSERVLALRAWIAVYLSSVNGDMEDRVRQVPRVNTSVVPDAELHVLAQQVRGDQRLDSQKATVTAHDFKSVQIHHSNTKLRVELSRFQTRVLQASLNQQLYLKLRDRAGATYTIPGRTTHTKGPVIWIAIQQPYSLHEKTVTELFTAGQDGGTASDRFKAADILAALQGKLNLFDNPFMRTIWPKPDSLAVWPESFTSPPPPPLVIAPNILINESQQEAVLHMLSLDNDKRITLIQGPPGTGKTTVIATYVVSATRADRGGIWLVAQSNVAVKNIAEKLIKINFYKWKLLVSKDFHLGWHEHLYQRVSRNIIRSDEFKTAAKELQGCQVILCTLSMLSHFLISNFTSQIPIQTLVVDEASQIKVSDYLHPLKTFHSIRKLCFIGDDKQLPPYGQEQIETIQSIFEVSHLRSSALFLDIQYRMPSQIGDFISEAMYDGQLRSNPSHQYANNYCTFFVNVNNSSEQPQGTSYYNSAEITTILLMASHFQQEGVNFKIISPYEAQSTAIQNALKNNGLVWHEKCFNVDSFQGNEEDIIILSLVRTDELGFLQDLRRTNVMLTRCREAMYIVSSWNFLVNGAGANSLVGRLAASCGEDAWISEEDIAEGNF